MRKTVTLLVALVLLLSGCWSRVEVTDLAVVTGMGVDKGEHAPVRVTLLVSRSTAGRGQQQQQAPQGQPVWGVAREAENITDAMRAIALASARRISLHHMRVVLVGEEYAREGIGSLLDFLVRSPQIRLMTRVMVVAGTAQSVFEVPPQLELLQSENLAEIIQAKGGVDQRLKEFAVARVSETHSGWLYMVRVIERPARHPGAPTRAAEIRGAALFLRDNLVAKINAEQANALLWLMNNPAQILVTAHCPGDPTKTMSGRVEEGRTKIIPTLAGKRLSFQVNARGRVEMIRTECGKDVVQPEVRGRMEKQFSDALAADIRDMIALIKKTGTDPAGFGKRLQLAYTPYWRSVVGRWPAPLQDAQVKVTAQITIQHTGLLLEPSNLTERELKAQAK